MVEAIATSNQGLPAGITRGQWFHAVDSATNTPALPHAPRSPMVQAKTRFNLVDSPITPRQKTPVKRGYCAKTGNILSRVFDSFGTRDVGDRRIDVGTSSSIDASKAVKLSQFCTPPAERLYEKTVDERRQHGGDNVCGRTFFSVQRRGKSQIVILQLSRFGKLDAWRIVGMSP